MAMIDQLEAEGLRCKARLFEAFKQLILVEYFIATRSSSDAFLAVIKAEELRAEYDLVLQGQQPSATIKLKRHEYGLALLRLVAEAIPQMQTLEELHSALETCDRIIFLKDLNYRPGSVDDERLNAFLHRTLGQLLAAQVVPVIIDREYVYEAAILKARV